MANEMELPETPEYLDDSFKINSPVVEIINENLTDVDRQFLLDFADE